MAKLHLLRKIDGRGFSSVEDCFELARLGLFKGELRGKIEVILNVWPLSHVSIFDNIIPISFHSN